MPAQSRGVQELTISNPSTLHPTSLRDPNQEREQWYVNHKMKKLDIPSIPEPFDIIADGGAGLRACKASVDLFSLDKADFIDQVHELVTVGEFYEIAAGGQTLFT